MKLTRSIVIGTAGHIDHGKTALVRALTGVNTDRLPEEKRRGITIDLGYASLKIAGPDGEQQVSFVDVPGHALFIRNMLAGAGCVPAVMLVIAANEGVMPQTREHLHICELLGMRDGFTVITKSDALEESQLAEIRNQVAAFLKGTFLDPDSHVILAASAHTGRGLEAVRAELAKLASRARQNDDKQPMRLPIDRAFIKKGFGTVVTGTLLSGDIRTGESLMLEPGKRSVRVRGLQTHGESEEVAQAGSRVAVNLSGIDATEIARGQTLVAPGELTATDTIDAEIVLLGEVPPLKRRSRVHLHAFTSEVMAAVSPYENEEVRPGTARLARLKLSSPVVLAPGDRFVIRQPLPAGTVGGGRVLDAHPLSHTRRAETRSWLEKIAAAAAQQQLVLRIERRASEGIGIVEVAREMGLTSTAAGQLASTAINRGEILAVGNGVLVSQHAFSCAVDVVVSHLKGAGANGLKRSELQSRTGLTTGVLNAIVEQLVRDHKSEIRNEVVMIAGAGPHVSDKDANALRSILAAYQSAGLAAPTVREAAQQLRIGEAEMRRLITLLLRQKALVRMGSDDVFVHGEALRGLAERLAPMRGKTIDVAAFKALTGLTRKHAIPLLEYLDRERITRKQGDMRVII